MQTLNGVIEITPSIGSAFFLRKEYLSFVDSNKVCAGAEFNDDEVVDILNAALVYSAEFTAMTYLARAEHCRFSLTQKLIKKGIDKKAIEIALDYLESIHYLDDERFAGAWLRTRSIDHTEGRIRLTAELLHRGVGRDVVRKAIDNFFMSHDEIEICRKALKKELIFKNDHEKIKKALVKKGFSLKEIEFVIKNNEDL